LIVLDCGAEAVSALAFGPTGGLLIGNRAGGLFRSDGFDVDPESAAEVIVRRLPVAAITFLGPAGSAVLGGEFGLVYLRLADGYESRLPEATTGPVSALAPVSDTLLAVGFGEPLRPVPGSFQLVNMVRWDGLARTEQQINRRDVDREHTGVRAVAAHPQTQTVAWSTGGKQVVVWTVTKPDKWRVSLPAAAPSLAFHPEGRWLAAAQDWNVLPVDTERKQLRDPMKGHKGRVTAVAFHPHDGTLYSVSWDGTVRLWDVATGAERKTFDWKLGRLTCLAVSPDGTRAAAGSEGGKVVIWDVI
jgi:WD40 repeat protein